MENAIQTFAAHECPNVSLVLSLECTLKDGNGWKMEIWKHGNGWNNYMYILVMYIKQIGD